MTSFATGLNLTESIIAANSAINPQTQCLIFGSRATNGVLIQPPANSTYSMPNLYIPFALPSFSDGVSAVNYLVQNYGYKVVWGIEFTETLPAPSSISNVQADGSYIFTWNVIPTGFSSLTGINLTGSVSQGINTGSIIANSTQINNNTAYMRVMPNGASVFNTSTIVTLNGVENIQKPNPNLSDQIIVGVYTFYAQAVLLPAGATTPNAWISVLSQNCTTIDPSTTPIVLTNPSATVINSDLSVSLTYPATAVGLGYLPITYLGNSTVSQNVVLPAGSVNALYFANGIYLQASANNSGIAYSIDGINWINSNIITGNFNSFYYNGTAFVATSSVGVYSSLDGITWNIVTGAANTGIFVSSYFANDAWVAASINGLYYTLDVTGATGWTVTTGAATGVFAKLAYGNNIWVATSGDNLYNSIDGITWNALSYTGLGFYAINFANGVFQVGSNNATNSGIYNSTDGITFNVTNITSGSFHQFIYENNMWIAIGTAGILYANNNTIWVPTNIVSGIFNEVVFNNNTWVAVSNAGIFYSLNGTAWSVTDVNSGIYTSLAFGNNIYIAGGTTGTTFSYNGSVWAINNNATGTYNGYTIDNFGNVHINVINVTNVFNIDDQITIILDGTQNAFNYLGDNQINGYVLPFPINQLTDLTVTQSSFYNGILNLNNGYAINQQKFLATGYYANLQPKGKLFSLPTPNMPIFKGAWKADQPTITDYAETPISMACTSAYLDFNCNIPYYSQANVVVNLSASSNATTYPSVGRYGDCDTAVSLGWTPFAINSQGQVYCWRNVTSMITLPNTPIQDVEFRFVSVWLKQRWLQQQVFAAWQTISTAPILNGGMVLNDPDTMQDFKTACQSILTNGGNLGMFQNTGLYLNLVTVVIDPLLPTGFDVKIPNQVVPELATSNVSVQLFSIYYNFTS